MSRRSGVNLVQVIAMHRRRRLASILYSNGMASAELLSANNEALSDFVCVDRGGSGPKNHLED